MSAVNILETPKGAMIFTDAAMYDGEGTILALARKCHVTETGLAVAGRGNALFPRIVAEAFDRHGWGMDDVLENGEAFIENGFAALETKFIEVAGKALNNVWVVGWSVLRDSARIVQWTNCPPAGTPRFSVVDVVMAPDLSAEGYQRARAAMVGTDPAKPDMAQVGLAMMKAQRLDQGSAEFGCAGKFLVGGHVMRTDVTREGITQSIVHEWPEDAIGERIRPTADFDPASAPNVSTMYSGSRALRRAEEKRARKAAKLDRRSA